MLLVDEIGNSYVHYTDDAESARPSNCKITTTPSLAVHAAADGVALGAAASTSQTSVQLIVFVASMLRKSPAAFGLVLFLMKGGLEWNQSRKHLLVFALAAPVMSMVTFLGLNKGSKEAFFRGQCHWSGHAFVCQDISFFLFILKILFIYFQREGKGGRQRKRGRKTSMCGCLLHAPHAGDLAHNPGMCPEWESNWRPFGSQPVLNPLSCTSQGSTMIFY